MNCLYKHNKISVTTAEFNGLSSEIYGNGIRDAPISKFTDIPITDISIIKITDTNADTDI